MKSFKSFINESTDTILSDDELTERLEEINSDFDVGEFLDIIEDYPKSKWVSESNKYLKENGITGIEIVRMKESGEGIRWHVKIK